MLAPVLIANRGEIVARIARTARRLGIATVAIASDADRGAPFIASCDRVVAIGGEHAADSYLRIDKIVAAARTSGARAVHPGYGFLSENEEFAQACADAGPATSKRPAKSFVRGTPSVASSPTPSKPYWAID